MNKVSKRVLGIFAVALALLSFAFAGPFARMALADDPAQGTITSEPSDLGYVNIYVNPTYDGAGRINESPVSQPATITDGDHVVYQYRTSKSGVIIHPTSAYIRYTDQGGNTQIKYYSGDPGSSNSGYYGYHGFDYDASFHGSSITVLTDSAPNGVFGTNMTVHVVKEGRGRLAVDNHESDFGKYTGSVTTMTADAAKHWERTSLTVTGDTSGNNVSYSWNAGNHYWYFYTPLEDCTVKAVFTQLDPMVTMELGSGHADVATGFAEYLNGESGIAECDAEADGTSVILYPDTNGVSIGQMQQTLADKLSAYLGTLDPAGEHNKEIIFASPLGQKTIDQYGSAAEVDSEISASTDELGMNQTYYALWDSWVFTEITWDGYTAAKANYVGKYDATQTKSVDCQVEADETDPATITYIATVSAEDSLDNEAHSDSKTEPKKWDLFVQGIQVTGENYSDVLGDGKVSFDPASNKLALNGAKIEMTLPKDASKVKEDETNDETGILSYLSGNLTINLTGTNTITNATDESGTEKLGVIVKGASSVTYTGGGTLNVSMPNEEAGHHWALVHEQPATVDGVNINVDIPGAKLPEDSHDKVGGIRMEGSNQLSLKNSAKVAINVGTGYAVDNNVQDNGDIDVAEGCMLVAITGGNNGALHGNRWVLPTDASKALGVLVNTEPTPAGRSEWDGTTRFENYKYVRIPGVKFVTVNYDLGEGHEELAQAEALKTAINSHYAMEVLEVDGAVVKIKVPELSDNNTKNTVARLLGALRAALNESVGHDPTYGPYWVYDQNEWNFNNALKTIDNYNSYEEVRAEREQLETDGTMPEEGQTIYALWAKPISEVVVNVESPVCGTEVTADLEDPEDPDMGHDPQTQKPQPIVSISTDRVSVNKDEEGWENTWWVDSTKKDESWFTILPPCYVGTMVGDEDYMLVVSAEPEFGYYIARDATYTTSNGKVDTKLSHSLDMFADIYITVTAQHELEKVDEVPATCTEDGAKEHWKCTHCGMLFADAEGTQEIAEAEAIPATGHDWGEWEVTKEATVDAEGEETRTCKHDTSHTETRATPKLDPIVYTNTAGDGNVWVKGSAVTSDFTFKRNVDDQTAFSHFEKAQVDGKDLASADYTAESGSVIIKLNPSFLETLAVGEHTLTAFFDDGNSADAKFTIVEGEKTFNLTFNLDGGTWNGQSGPVVTPIPEGVTIVFTDDVPTKDGFTFAGWKDAAGKVYKVGDTFEVTADASFTAVWEAAAKPAPKPAPKKATPSTGDAVAFGSMVALAASGFVSLVAAKATRKKD